MLSWSVNYVISYPSESYTQLLRRLVERGKKKPKADQNSFKPAGRPIRFNDSNEVEAFEICTSLISGLFKHKYSKEFAEPIDIAEHGIHDYHSIIKNPMDLGTVKENLKTRLYKSPKEFAADTRLVFENAMTYNPESHIVHLMAAELLEFFNKNYAREEENYNLELDRSGEANEVNKRDMTYEEKLELNENLGSLSVEELGKVVEIFKKRNIVFSIHDDVVGVNINNIDVDILWELDRLVINYKSISNKNMRKSLLEEAETASVSLMNASANLEIAEETYNIGDRSVVLALPIRKTWQEDNVSSIQQH
ncbi:transcription factor GTE4-like [Impatiens glandulifera]|uniref:transcription factor GTE4-like n=1 Tax=Impatiens glandulifera TaxID=253017 RepID=UPI001FB0FCA4|nr:transcription factor GTE4-like [Impatiens glandulifera]